MENNKETEVKINGDGKNKTDNLLNVQNIVYPKKIEDTADYQYHFWTNEPICTIHAGDFDNKISMSENYEGSFIGAIDKPIADFVTKNYNDRDKTGRVTIFNSAYLNWLFGKNKVTYVLKYMGDICGIINASIVDMINFKIIDKFADINFICVHKGARHKNISVLLIKKIREELLKQNIKQGEFFSDVYIPHPISAVSFYWTSVNNPELFVKGIKNVENNDKEMPIIREDYYKNYHGHVKEDKYTMRLADIDDYEQLYQIYKTYITIRYKFGELYSYDEFLHKFANSDIVNTYILFKEGVMLDFISIVKTTRQINREIFNVGTISMYTSKNAHIYITLINLMIELKETKTDLLEMNDTMEFDNHIMTYDLKFEIKSDSNHYLYLYNSPKKVSKGINTYDMCKMIVL